jgi:antitoxin VapB
MPFHVRDEVTDALVRELAAKRGVGLTQAVQIAVKNELQRMEAEIPLPKRIAAIRRRIAPRLLPTIQTDKAFFADLSGDA